MYFSYRISEVEQSRQNIYSCNFRFQKNRKNKVRHRDENVYVMFAFIILDDGGVLSLNSLIFKTKINTKGLATVI